MAQSRSTTLMVPPIEELLEKVDSKFTLVALSAKRGRQINSYYNQLGEGLGYVVPPQVTSVSGKSLTIAFEEIAAGKAVAVRRDPAEDEAGEGEASDDGTAEAGDAGAVAALESGDAAVVSGEEPAP
jgi:DNA-directed RNA polymerase subunit omega